MNLNFNESTFDQGASDFLYGVTEPFRLNSSEIAPEDNTAVNTPSREEFQAKMETLEARMDARVGVVVAKIDAMEVYVKTQMERATAAAELAAKSAEKAGELKQTLWVTAVATIISVLGIAFSAYYGMQQSNIGLVQAVTAMFQLGQQNPPGPAISPVITPPSKK